MRYSIFGASRERACALRAAGCPIDFLDALPHDSFRVEQLSGSFASWISVLGPTDQAYLIALRLSTDRPSGTIIDNWSFEQPSENPVLWDYEPEEFIPKREWSVYRDLVKPGLSGVLNDRRRIRRGCPVEGVLCGRSFWPMRSVSGGIISARLSFTDDRGTKLQLSVDLEVRTHRHSSIGQLRDGRTRLPRNLEHAIDSAEQAGLTAFRQSLTADADGDSATPALHAGNPNSNGKPSPTVPMRVRIEIRDRDEVVFATLERAATGNGVTAIFDEPQRAVTPGHSGVFF